jgi:Flp pilus assembly protein TadB
MGSTWFNLSFLSNRKRMQSFEREYPALLVALASMTKAGNDPFIAMLECRELFSCNSEMYQQLEAVSEAIAHGKTEKEALREFGKALEFVELDLLRSVLILGRQEGASLGNALMRLARVTRQRQSFYRKAQGSLAMQRLSTLGILICAISIVFMQYVANPEAVHLAITHPIGSLALSGGLLLVVVGGAWMIWLSQRKIGVC